VGTTLTAIQAGSLGLQFIAAVEGVTTLAYSGSDASLATTAWSGTDFNAAVTGMRIRWGDGQSLKPWSADVDPMNVEILIPPGSADTFGVMVFGSARGFETRLNAELTATATTVTVLSTSTFPSSGSIYIGTERIEYTGKTATTFTGCTRGYAAPFKASSETGTRFGRAHVLPDVADGMVIKPWVTSQPRVWVGRWVGIWAHQLKGGVLDTKAQAQLVFAGRIVGTRDEADGHTVIELQDARAAIRDCVLLRDQWTAQVAEGIYLQEGWVFDAADTEAGTTLQANALTVVSGSAGANEILAGIYSLEDFASALNEWLFDEFNAGRLGILQQWEPRVYTSDGQIRSRMQYSGGSATSTNLCGLHLPPEVKRYMGFSYGGEPPGSILRGWEDSATQDRTSDLVPLAVLIPVEATGSYNIDVENVRGTWFNNTSYFPSDWSFNTTLFDNVGAVQIGDGPVFLMDLVDANTLAPNVALSPVLNTQVGEHIAFYERSAADPPLILRQVGIIVGDFLTVLTRILTSTGTASYNGSYDVFPAQLGAAIPWELLGTGWTTSMVSLSSSMPDPFVVITEPTGIIDQIGCDLVAGLSGFVWKDQGIRIGSWSTPAAAIATHAFTENNKAAPAGTRDEHRTPANETDEYQINQIKLEYDRVLSGGYRYTVNLIDKASQYDHGMQRAVTISLRNTFTTPANGPINAVSERLATALRTFSQPLRILRRTILPAFYEGCAPGDIGTIADDWVRDPLTGTRSVTAKACLVMAHRADWGDADSPPHGEVDLVILPRAKVVAYCPTAQVNETAPNAGYDAGTKTLTLHAHKHSESSQTVDVGRFAAGDKVRIIEIDPDDPASPTTWLDTIVSVNTGANTCVLTTGLAGWSTALRYRMIAQSYTDCVAAQQVNVFQADDADGMVQDTISAYEYGYDSNTAVTWTEDDFEETSVALYAALASGDGKPLATGYEFDAARLANSLVSARTAPSDPVLYRNTLSVSGTPVWQILAIEPYTAHPGVLNARTRHLRYRVWARTSDGSSRTIRISLCRHPPIGSSLSQTDTTIPTFVLVGPYESDDITVASSTWDSYGGTLDLKMCDPGTGIGYIVIQGQQKIETRGFAQLLATSLDAVI